MINAQFLRLSRGESVNQVANATGIANVTIARLEKTEQPGSYDVMAKLASYFGVEPNDLLTPVKPVEEAA